MRVLAIDTALEACSAAVFDTSSGILASETRGMARGHAEQLMPLIARVMNEGGFEFADLDRIAVTPHRGHHGAGQFHRAPRWNIGGTWHRISGGKTRDRTFHACRIRSAPDRRR